MQAIGLVEMRGLTAAVEALDQMCKTAAVTLIQLKIVGSGFVTVIVEGEVAAVNAAVEIGKDAHQQAGGQFIAAEVIPRPHPELHSLLYMT